VSNLLVIDTETTGTDPARNSLLSVALVPMEEPEKGREWFVEFDLRKLEWSADGWPLRNFDRFEEQWVRQAKPSEQVWVEIRGYLTEHFPDGATLVGHFVEFDLAFAKQLGPFHRIGQRRTIDTKGLARVCRELGRIPENVRLGLSGLCKHFGIEIPENARHTALGDAIATRELYLRLVETLR
jgi:DNA polymerase-3 subunit epsilon